MAAVPFQTHVFIRRMETAGMPHAQAEALAETLTEVAMDQLVTKTDLAFSLKDLENRLLLKMGAMIAGSTAITITVLSAISKFH